MVNQYILSVNQMVNGVFRLDSYRFYAVGAYQNKLLSRCSNYFMGFHS